MVKFGSLYKLIDPTHIEHVDDNHSCSIAQGDILMSAETCPKSIFAVQTVPENVDGCYIGLCEKLNNFDQNCCKYKTAFLYKLSGNFLCISSLFIDDEEKNRNEGIEEEEKKIINDLESSLNKNLAQIHCHPI